MPEKEIIVENACFDEPRASDRTREQVFGDEMAEWSKQFVKWPEWTIVYNQNLDPRTLKWCVWYAVYHIYNAQQMNEWKNNWSEFIQEDPKNYWFRFQAYRGRPNTWSSLQQHLDFMRKQEKSIEWSVLCQTEEQMKMAVDRWYFILSWSKRCDWTKTGKTWIFSLVDDGPDHGIAIVGYDWKWFIAKNSFWGWRWNKWYFYIPFGYKKYLFSCNAIIDADSTGKLQAYKFEKEYQESIKLGITDGTNPDKPATRKECSVMIYRMYKNLLKK